jgi:hypothetical protein
VKNSSDLSRVELDIFFSEKLKKKQWPKFYFRKRSLLLKGYGELTAFGKLLKNYIKINRLLMHLMRKY